MRYVLRLIKCHILKPICQSFDIVRYLFLNLTWLKIKEFHCHLLVSISTYPSFFHLHPVFVSMANTLNGWWCGLWMLRCRLNFETSFRLFAQEFQLSENWAMKSHIFKCILLLIVAIDNQVRISRNHHFEACLCNTLLGNSIWHHNCQV